MYTMCARPNSLPKYKSVDMAESQGYIVHLTQGKGKRKGIAWNIKINRRF